VKIEYDEEKRRKILTKRGIDMAEAALVFDETHVEVEDHREDYGETRYRVWGFLHGRRVSLVWTPRLDARRIITIRHAHGPEHEARFRALD
jgi:uncharacterized DUF497 family protein